MNILVAMSGGVDSAMTALVLQQDGHNVEGCYMRLFGDKKDHEKNIAMVQRAADFLGIKYHILDLRDEFDKAVYMPFVDAYKDGLTPNPCALCNKNIKFGQLAKFAKKLGFDALATGHYAKIENGLIREARDKSKDQSYFLGQISPEIIPFLMFPLGEKLKKDVKSLAETIPQLKDFSSQQESREICFVEKTYIDVLKKHVNTDQIGEVLNVKNEVTGIHLGYMHYTIGKRRGFEIRGAHEPHYVIATIPEKNQIIAGIKEELPEIKTFRVKSLNMFKDNISEVFVKIRYRSKKFRCKVTVDRDKKEAEIFMQEAVTAVARGQLAVFYENEKIVGSGIIA